MRGMKMTALERLRSAVSTADASLKSLLDEDPDVRMDAVLDMAGLLTAAKAVVLAA
jgi:hypothetical protein